jgi:hypothetical protein
VFSETSELFSEWLNVATAIQKGNGSLLLKTFKNPYQNTAEYTMYKTPSFEAVFLVLYHNEFLIIKALLFSICSFLPFRIICANTFPMTSKLVEIVVIPFSTTFLSGVSLYEIMP